MSFDVFLQPFANGESTRSDHPSISALVTPLVVDTDQGWAHLVTSDGEADLYGYDDLASGCMINHAAGDAIWDVVVAIASVGRFAIMPVGCPTCVTDPSMLTHLPPELAAQAILITSGSDLLRVIQSS